MRNRFLLFLGSTALLAACSSDSDSKDEKANEAFWPQCEETRRVVGLDDETPFGITPRQAFEGAQGEHTAELTWEGGDTTALSLVFTTELAEVELVDREPKQGGEGPAIELAHYCDDYFEAKFDVTFSTEDGAFDESFRDMRLRWEKVGGTGVLRANHGLDFDALQGSYEPKELDPSDYDRIVQPSVRIEIADEALSGDITYMAEKQHGDGPNASVSAMQVTVATWK